MPAKNYYEILGVAQTATQEEIKKAYEQLRLKNYPTSNPKNPYEATAKLNELFEAYKALGYPEKREEYDKILKLSEQLDKLAAEKEILSLYILGFRFVIKKIKKTSTVKIEAYKSGVLDYLDLGSLFLVSFVLGTAVFLGFVSGFMIGVIATLMFTHKKPFYLEKCLEEKKFIKETTSLDIIFDSNIRKMDMPVKRSFPLLFKLIIISVVVFLICKYIFKIDMPDVPFFFLLGFIYGDSWAMSMWEYPKIQKLKANYKKDFKIFAEYSDIWIGREK